MRRSLLVMAFVLALPAVAGADRASHRYRVGDHPDLHLSTDDARVEIRPGRAGVIEIEVETERWRIGPGDVKVVESQSGDQVRFEVREPRRWGLQWNFDSRRRRITITAAVPPELDLTVVTADGPVRVTGLRGRVRIHTGDGPVEASDLHGALSLETGDGSIEALGLRGDLETRTGDGRVHVEGRFQSLRMRSGDGPITVAVDPGSEVTGEWLLTTGDGSLTLRLPHDLRADLEASTSDGRITTDLPLSVRGSFSRRSIHGELNGGGPPIALRSGDGAIRIEER